VSRVFITAFFALALSSRALAQDKVFSGPQPGEKITSFKVLDVTGAQAGKEADYVGEYKGAPTVLIFMHGLERSMLPLVRVVDQYAAEKKTTLKALYIYLTDDRVAAEQRLPLVQQSIRLQWPLTISVDGPEGPGNYGLNKRCLLTILVAKENRVTANFALVQPGIADAPKVLAAIAAVVGDPNPPAADALEARRQAQGGRGTRPAAMERPGGLDASRFDLATEKGLREAVAALLAEVQSLRQEIAGLRAQNGQPARPAATRPGDLPGAAPTDPKLIGMLRAFIQPSNDDATVDRVLKEVEDYVKGNADLTKQAENGWIRVLHLKYGTEYAQKSGKAFVERLKR
jgi:hypothetical protein